MAKPMVDMTIQNNNCDRLRVCIKDSGEELVLSRGEVAFVLASGVGGHQPTFALFTTDDSIEITASHAEGYFLKKVPPKSKNFDTQTLGLWDRELDGKS